MLDALAAEHQPARFEVADDFAVRVFGEEAAAGQALGHRPVRVDGLGEEEAVQLAILEVLATEGGGDVHDARAVVERDVAGGEHATQAVGVLSGFKGPQVAVAAEAADGAFELLGAVEGFVDEPNEFRAHEGANGRALLPEHALGERLRQDEVLALVLVEAVGSVLHDCEGGVAGEGPGGGGPGDDAGGGAVSKPDAVARLRGQPELDVDAGVGDVVAVALREFVVAQACLAAGAVGRAAVVLVDEPVVPELLEDPPAALDVVVVVGDVGVVHVGPEGDALGERLEVAHVAVDALAAPGVELVDAVGLDLGLGVQPQLLLDLDLDGQAVGVPAGLAGHAVAAHRLVAREQVLDDAGHDVVHTGTAVRRGRAFVEDEEVVLGTLLDAAPEDVVVAPEVENAGLEFGEAHARVDGSEELGHVRPPRRGLPGRAQESPSRSGTGAMPAVPPCFPHEAGPLRSAITLPPSLTVGDPHLRAFRPGLLAGWAGVRPEAREGCSRPAATPPHTNGAR